MALVQTLMPHAQIEWLADSIHDVQLQRPELVAERIYAFAKALA
jgi:pimeloyl-ACP methyl ester carboxylesterase